jgi:hypothetical protein
MDQLEQHDLHDEGGGRGVGDGMLLGVSCAFVRCVSLRQPASERASVVRGEEFQSTACRMVPPCQQPRAHAACARSGDSSYDAERRPCRRGAPHTAWLPCSRSRLWDRPLAAAPVKGTSENERSRCASYRRDTDLRSKLQAQVNLIFLLLCRHVRIPAHRRAIARASRGLRSAVELFPPHSDRGAHTTQSLRRLCHLHWLARVARYWFCR